MRCMVHYALTVIYCFYFTTKHENDTDIGEISSFIYSCFLPQSEYIAECDGRRSFISGFTGSFGMLIVNFNTYLKYLIRSCDLTRHIKIMCLKGGASLSILPIKQNMYQYHRTRISSFF